MDSQPELGITVIQIFLVLSVLVHISNAPLVFSQDRVQEIEFANDGDKLRLIASTASPSSAEWSPDGTRIVSISGLVAVVFDAATGLELLRLQGHTNSVTLASFSPDGQRIVTASRDGTARVWYARTGVELYTLKGHTSGVFSASFSPDGQRIVTASGDGTARVWDAERGVELLTLNGHTDSVSSASFSPEGRRIVTASDDRTARVWDAGAGRELHTLKWHTNWVKSASFSPDGQRIVTTSDDSTARVWDAGTGGVLYTLDGHTKSVLSASFSPDGHRIVTASVDRTARVWDADTGKVLQTVGGRHGWVLSASFSPNGGRIVTSSGDGAATVWDAATGIMLHLLDGHTDWVEAAWFSPDGERVLTSSRDGTAIVWDAGTGVMLHKLDGQADLVLSAWFSAEGRHIITGSWDCTARVWETGTGVVRHILWKQTDWIRPALFHHGRRITTQRWDPIAQVWDTGTGVMPQALGGDLIVLFSFSPDGKRVVTASGNIARVWDEGTGTVLHTLVGHTDVVDSVWFTPDSRHIVTTSLDGTARVWDSGTGTVLHTIVKSHIENFLSDSISPDVGRLVTVFDHNMGRVWDVGTGVVLCNLEGHTGSVRSASFSPDGQRIVTTSDDTTARVWDAGTGLVLHTLEGHTEAVLSASFSPDGQRIVTASDDMTARVWDAGTGVKLYTLEGHTDSAVSGSFSPDGLRIVTASKDNTARVWDTESGREIAQLLAFTDGSWAVLEPGTGRYDAGPAGKSTGECSGLHWVYDNREVILLQQFKKDYWHPGLLADIWAGKELPSTKSLDEITVYPKVTLAGDVVASRGWGEATLSGPQFEIQLTNDGGGIGSVQLTVNGKLVAEDLRPRGSDPQAESLTVPIDLTQTGLLIPGEPNRIEVRVSNAAGTVLSRPSKATYTPPAPEQSAPKQVRVHALVAGASDYLGDDLDLNYAAADAIAFADALELAAERLVCLENAPDTNCDGLVRVRRLIADGSTPLADQPTRDNILRELESIAAVAEPQDIVVVFLAGHGTTVKARRKGRDDADTYLYLTPEAGTWTEDDLRSVDGERVTVSGTDIEEILRRSRAVKQLLILDTCGSGGAAADLGATRALSSEQIKELDRTASRSGVWLLAGSATDAVSYEASRFGQGVLTYALLEWLRTGELRNGEYVDVSQWFEAAADRVPDLARGLGGIQMPQIVRGFLPISADRTTQQASFSVGRLEESDRERINLPNPKPVFVRARFTDPDDGGDPLQFGEAVNAALRLAEAEGRLVAVRADRAPDAYRLTGLYSVHGETATLSRLRLRLGEEDVLTLDEVFVTAASEAALPQAVADRIMELIAPVLDRP